MNFYSTVTQNGFYGKANRLRFYLEQQLFKGINFKEKSLIDIGGGSGLFSFYAAVNGASEVVVMEPEFDGSSKGMIEGFRKIKSILGPLENITHTTKVLEDYDRVNNQFDFILMHNSINHIDEEACINLKKDAEAQRKYLNFFQMLTEISKPDTILLIHDCTNRNFFNDIGLVCPFAKTIEWDKHQTPEVWAGFLEQVGFSTLDIQRTTLNALGRPGKLLFNNSFSSYMTHSAFLLTMKREPHK